MIRHAHSLRVLLNRIRGQPVGESGPFRDDLNLVPTIQPVLLVGDRSQDAAWPRGARGAAGAALNQLAGQQAFLEFESHAAGGTLIHWLHVSSEGSPTDLAWRWTVGPIVGTNVAGSVISIDPAFPVAAQLRRGYTAPAGISFGNLVVVGGYQVVGSSGQPAIALFQGLWLPPGQALYLGSYTATRSLHASLYFTEYPVLQPA